MVFGRVMGTGSWSWAVLGAGAPAWHWGARSVGGSRDPIPAPFPTCPAPFPNNPWHRLPSLQRPVRKLLSLPASLRGPGDQRETTSLRSHPQPLVCLVRRSRGHVFANFVTAFIKWGFTGALSSISGLVGELNKTVWDAGLLWRRYLFREEWSLRSLPCAGEAGQAGTALEGPPRSFSWGSGAQTGELSTVQTGSRREPGSLEDRPVGLSGEGSDGTLGSGQPLRYTWAHLQSVRCLGSRFLSSPPFPPS